jgi:putative transposase
VSRAGFYRGFQEPQPVEEEMEVRSLIQQIAIEHRRRYGYRRISAELRRRGMAVNHKRVARIMREDNLLAVQPRQFVVTTKSDHKLEVYLNLARRLKLTGMDQLWVADITYIRLKTEFVYLAVILDGFSRKVVGWSLERTLASRLVLAALEQAIATRNPSPGLVHHSDRGVQYASEEYVAVLERYGMIPSMSRPANPYDNASCESFLKTLKREEIYANQYRDLDHLRGNIEEFIERYYNQQRLHSALGYRSPEEFEQQAKHSDSTTQLCSPSLELFPSTKEEISTKMLEQGTQTPSPAPDLIPARDVCINLQPMARCVIQNCLTSWVHPMLVIVRRCAVGVPYASSRYELKCFFSIPRQKCFRAGFFWGKSLKRNGERGRNRTFNLLIKS